MSQDIASTVAGLEELRTHLEQHGYLEGDNHFETLTAAISVLHSLAPIAPRGYVCVPREPTEAMIGMGHDAGIELELPEDAINTVISIYLAMLAAAPTVPAQEPVAWINKESLLDTDTNPDTIGASRYSTQFRNFPIYAAAPSARMEVGTIQPKEK